MRILAYQFIRVEVRNGKRAFLWHDDWLRTGKFIDVTGATGTRYLGVICNPLVCDDVSWSVRGHPSRNFQELHHTIQAEPIQSSLLGNDKFLWRHDTDVYKDYSFAANT